MNIAQLCDIEQVCTYYKIPLIGWDELKSDFKLGEVLLCYFAGND